VHGYTILGNTRAKGSTTWVKDSGTRLLELGALRWFESGTWLLESGTRFLEPRALLLSPGLFSWVQDPRDLHWHTYIVVCLCVMFSWYVYCSFARRINMHMSFNEKEHIHISIDWLDVPKSSHCSNIWMLCLGIVGNCYLFFSKDVLAYWSLTLVLAWSYWYSKAMSLNVFKRSVTDNWECKCLCIAKQNAMFYCF
jgi:hypothetical protein